MQSFSYKTQGVCSQQIDFSLDGDTVHDVHFLGGCNGNLKAISKLVEGMKVDRIKELLLGNTCGYKPTSCADQFAKAVLAAYEKVKEQ